MKHSTYKRLYASHLGVVDKKGLLEARNEESDPFYQDLLDKIVENNTSFVDWDVKQFTTEFLSGSPRQKLDETFFAFVLKTLSHIKIDSYMRTYRKPESHHVILAWVSILRSVIHCGLALLYNVKWTDESVMNHLEPAITKLVGLGEISALRKLMLDLGITLSQKEPFMAESSYNIMHYLPINYFGSFYWRYLHWMAEAVALRGEDANSYKNEWLNLLKGPLYRTLQCKICMLHFKSLLDEHDKELSFENLPRLFFKIHNRTHAYRREYFKLTVVLQEPDYTESQYEADSEFMRKAL